MISRMETLEIEAQSLGIILNERILMPDTPLDGLYLAWDDDAVILINRHRPLSIRIAALAEELGHHCKSVGIVLSQDTVQKRKSEAAGRAWSFERLLPATDINGAIRSGTCEIWELADMFSLPEGFIQEAMQHYQRKSLLLSIQQCHWCYAG